MGVWEGHVQGLGVGVGNWDTRHSLAKSPIIKAGFASKQGDWERVTALGSQELKKVKATRNPVWEGSVSCTGMGSNL